MAGTAVWELRCTFAETGWLLLSKQVNPAQLLAPLQIGLFQTTHPSSSSGPTCCLSWSSWVYFQNADCGMSVSTRERKRNTFFSQCVFSHFCWLGMLISLAQLPFCLGITSSGQLFNRRCLTFKPYRPVDSVAFPYCFLPILLSSSVLNYPVFKHFRVLFGEEQF